MGFSAERLPSSPASLQPCGEPPLPGAPLQGTMVFPPLLRGLPASGQPPTCARPGGGQSRNSLLVSFRLICVGLGLGERAAEGTGPPRTQRNVTAPVDPMPTPRLAVVLGVCSAG